MTVEEEYIKQRKYEVSKSENPDTPEMFGVVDELIVARISGNKELQEKIEKGEEKRYAPALFRDVGKISKKREGEINRSWRNAERKNKEWEEELEKKGVEK